MHMYVTFGVIFDASQLKPHVLTSAAWLVPHYVIEPPRRFCWQLGAMTVTLSGVGTKPVTLTADFSTARASSSSAGAGVTDMPVHRMAAKAYIKELQDDEGRSISYCRLL